MTTSKDLALYSRGCAVRIWGEGKFCWGEQEELAQMSLTPVVVIKKQSSLAYGRQGRKNHEFKPSLGYTGQKPCLGRTNGSCFFCLLQTAVITKICFWNYLLFHSSVVGPGYRLNLIFYISGKQRKKKAKNRRPRLKPHVLCFPRAAVDTSV